MIEVFKTNVEHASDADRLITILVSHFPGSRINFDLEDCDKILRIDYDDAVCKEVIHLFDRHGFVCEVLE